MSLHAAGTVHVDGQAVRSCQTLLGDVAGAEVTTIEGLGNAAALHAVQAAWLAGQVVQCGYCQSGQIMQAAALLSEVPDGPLELRLGTAADSQVIVVTAGIGAGNIAHCRDTCFRIGTGIWSPVARPPDGAP